MVMKHRSGSSRLCRRSEEHTSELQSPCNLVRRLLLEKKHAARYDERLVALPPLPVIWRLLIDRREGPLVILVHAGVVNLIEYSFYSALAIDVVRHPPRPAFPAV